VNGGVRVRRMRAQVVLLAAAQALFQTASTIVVTIGGLAGSLIAPSRALATAPIASMFLGTVLTTVPASLWMARAGRRRGFVTGALLGTLGGLLAAAGMYSGSLLALSLGTLLVGSHQAFAQFYRFAASETADDDFRPRAISLVLAGGIVAAIVGPPLAALGRPALGSPFVGSFLIISLVCATAAMLMIRLRVPHLRRDDPQSKPRPLVAIMRQPTYAVALFAAATGSGVMVLAMTATPLAMVGAHHGVTETATVIQLHTLGMFVPSLFTGSLIARFGAVRIMSFGIALLSTHVLLSLTGAAIVSFGAALVALGIGWNFLYVGGTTLLTSTYARSEAGRAQAAHDVLVLIVVLASSFAAAALLEHLGWQLLNVVLLPWMLAATIAISRLQRRPSRASQVSERTSQATR
jgi:predicted MFS family arabinose efflux permease